MGEFFRNDYSKLIESASRCVIALQADVDPWTELDSMVDLTTFDVRTSYITDLGSAREGQGSSYERGIEVAELKVEQDTGVVFTSITDVPRKLTVQIAEWDWDKAAIFEQGEVDTVNAGSGRSPQKRVDFGNIESLVRYSVAMLGVREVGQGSDITDEDGDVRGEAFAVVLHSATLDAAAASFELQRGQLANIPLVFNALPHPDIDDSRAARGCWLFENGPATIAPGS
jgi:hypothetical protein